MGFGGGSSLTPTTNSQYSFPYNEMSCTYCLITSLWARNLNFAFIILVGQVGSTLGSGAGRNFSGKGIWNFPNSQVCSSLAALHSLDDTLNHQQLIIPMELIFSLKISKSKSEFSAWRLFEVNRFSLFHSLQDSWLLWLKGVFINNPDCTHIYWQ